MCTCVELIKSEISSVNRCASSVTSQSLDIDSFLDTILEARNMLSDINSRIEQILEKTRSIFIDMPVKEAEIISLLNKDLVMTLLKLHSMLKQSNIGKGLITELKILKSNIDDLNEMRNDLSVFRVQLPQDNDFLDLMKSLKAL